MTVVTAYAVFADADEAARVGRILVEERLAACVNIIGPCQSYYWWDGAVQQADEVAALFKTSIATADALIARITELHSYDVPAITVWPVERLPLAFAEWVETEVR